MSTHMTRIWTCVMLFITLCTAVDVGQSITSPLPTLNSSLDTFERKLPATVCVNPANPETGSPMNVFMWTEYETESPTFFRNLMNFVLENCFAGRLTRLIMRMATPTTKWLPSVKSPFYTEFLAKLHANGIVVELVFFPYMMVPSARISWGRYIGKVYAPLDGAVQFMQRWNKVIADGGFKSSFTGLVFDYEESRRGWASYPAIDLNAGTISRLRNTYGNFELGVTVGWDDVKKFAAMPWVDRWYTQMYDLYDSSGALDRTGRSPFIVYKNNPQGLINYLLKVLIKPWIQAQYNIHANKISAMWSLQSPTKQCLYVYTNGVCVGNSEFGLWSASSVNLFLTKLKAAWPAMETTEHGFYHFALLPTSWVQ